MNLVIELSAYLYDAFVGVAFVTYFTKNKLLENKFLSLIATVLIFSVSTFFYFIDDFMLLHSGIILLLLFLYSFIAMRNHIINLPAMATATVRKRIIACTRGHL